MDNIVDTIEENFIEEFSFNEFSGGLDDDSLIQADNQIQLDYSFKNEMNLLLFEILTYGDSDALADFLNETYYIDINTYNENLETPLIFSCKRKYIDCAKIILKHKNTLLNRQDSNGDTALHICLRNNLDEITNLLLDDWRLDVNYINNYNETILHLVCSRGNPSHISHILKFNDLNLNKKDMFGHTALDYLLNTDTDKNTSESIIQIISHRNFFIDSFNITEDKLKKLYKYIITFNKILEKTNNKLITPIDTLLTFSCRFGIKDLFIKLLEIKTTDINLINGKSESPIYLALLNHHIDIFYTLLNHSDFRPPPKLLEFIFQYCYCDDSIIQYLSIILNKNYKNINILTVLNLAIEEGNLNVFRFFLQTDTSILHEYSADFSIRAINHSPKIYYYLLTLPQLNLDDRFVYDLVNIGDPQFLKLFLDRYRHINYNSRNSSNYSPIMIAVKNKHYEIIELLKDKSKLTSQDIVGLFKNCKYTEKEFLDVFVYRLKVNWCEVFGETLENMPDFIFKCIVSSYQSDINKLALLTSIIHTVNISNALEILNNFRDKIKGIDLDLCHNNCDFAYYESFSEMNKLEVIQYGELIKEKYRTIKAQSLYDITMSSGFGYLRDIVDPIDRSKLCNKICATTGLYIYPDYIFRKIIKTII
jgi:ankyrin repeat protein